MANRVQSLVLLAGVLMFVLTLAAGVLGLILGSGASEPLAVFQSPDSREPLVVLLLAGLLAVALAMLALYFAAHSWIVGRLRQTTRELLRLAGKQEERSDRETGRYDLDSALSVVGWRLRQAQQDGDDLTRTREHLARRDRSTHLVREIVKQINSSLEISQLRATTLRSLLSALNADFTAFLWIDAHQRAATLERVGRETGVDRTVQHPLAALPANTDELSRMLERWQAWNWIAIRLDNPDYQALHAPLTVAGRFSGMLVALRSGEWNFTEDEGQMFGIIVENLQVALENARLYDLAIRDELTGLFTRRYFEQRADQEISRCRRLRVPLSLVMIDLNHFKSVNDQLGHPTGDHLLAEVGKVIFSSVRNFDLPVRYGGDEFLVVLPNANHDQAELVVERITQNFQHIPPPRLRGADQVGLAFGIATYPDDANDTADLVRLSDHRMYEEKFETRPHNRT